MYQPRVTSHPGVYNPGVQVGSFTLVKGKIVHPRIVCIRVQGKIVHPGLVHAGG